MLLATQNLNSKPLFLLIFFFILGPHYIAQDRFIMMKYLHVGLQVWPSHRPWVLVLNYHDQETQQKGENTLEAKLNLTIFHLNQIRD